MNDAAAIAKGILRAEHRALAAVINTMKALLTHEEGARDLDYPLWWAMIHYIDAFPERLHHPKEERWLFARLRLRSPTSSALLDSLDAQHKAEPLALGEIRRHLGNLEGGVPGSRAALAAAVNAFAEFSWSHMHAEEGELFFLADAHLSEQDWSDVARAFEAHLDPLAGIDQTQDLTEHFRRIVTRAPAPHGLGG